MFHEIVYLFVCFCAFNPYIGPSPLNPPANLTTPTIEGDQVAVQVDVPVEPNIPETSVSRDQKSMAACKRTSVKQVGLEEANNSSIGSASSPSSSFGTTSTCMLVTQATCVGMKVTILECMT